MNSNITMLKRPVSFCIMHGLTIVGSLDSRARGSQEFKNYPGSIFFVKALATPPPTFQTRYVFIQKWYVFPTLLLKKFPAVLLVGRKPRGVRSTDRGRSSHGMRVPPSCHIREIHTIRLETAYCGITTNCSAVVTRDGFEQMGGVFEIGMTV